MTGGRRANDLEAHHAIKRWILARLAPAVGGLPTFEGGAKKPEAIIAQLATSQRRAVAQILKRIVLQDGFAGDVRVTDFELLDSVLDAFIASRLLVVVYTDADGVESERRIEPHGLLVRPPRWYVLAWDLTRHDARSLRLDRLISAVPVLGSAFRPRRLSELFEGLKGMPLDVEAIPG